MKLQPLNSRQWRPLQAVAGLKTLWSCLQFSALFWGLSSESSLPWRSTPLLACSRDGEHTSQTDRQTERQTDRQTDSELLQKDSLRRNDAHSALFRRFFPCFFFFSWKPEPVPLPRRPWSPHGHGAKKKKRGTPCRGAPNWEEKKNKQTSRHITRNATSKREQTQPEDCFSFYFISLLLSTQNRQERSSQSAGQTRRTGRSNVTATVLFFHFILIK